jgi:DNA-binding NarL/FixJ family response regulator
MKQTTLGAKRRVLLVDDHPIVRRGLGQLIERQPDLMVCGEAQDVDDALRAAEKTSPDAAIVDLCLRNSSGLDLIRAMKERFPSVLLLVLSMHQDSFYVERALREGIMGFLAKEEAAGAVLVALRQVLNGEFYLSEQMSAKLVGKMVLDKRGGASSFPMERLSPRELEVFELLGEGFSTRAVAQQLHLSVKTVETHRAKIKEKLRLRDGVELLQRAIQWAQVLKKKSGPSPAAQRQ